MSKKQSKSGSSRLAKKGETTVSRLIGELPSRVDSGVQYLDKRERDIRRYHATKRKDLEKRSKSIRKSFQTRIQALRSFPNVTIGTVSTRFTHGIDGALLRVGLIRKSVHDDLVIKAKKKPRRSTKKQTPKARKKSPKTNKTKPKNTNSTRAQA